jgi:signal transduction histidine kinase
MACVEIRDFGPGMPEEVRKRIFDPFFTTKGVGKGTGQGLAIAHAVVVKKHGGRLTCDSVPGEGTTFTMELPLREVEVHE